MLDGNAVHAIRGERAYYQPVRSVLCDTPDPLALARAFREKLGLSEVYVADLNAIQSSGRTDHRNVIAGLIHSEKMDVILDAGISDVENTMEWLDHGVRKVVIGSETLLNLQAVQDIPAGIKRDRLIFSLDLQSGKTLSRCPALESMTPLEALKHLQRSGWQEVILLDLRRVGSAEGADRVLAAEAKSKFPELNLWIGGGIAGQAELFELKAKGIAKVLIATALHSGIIDAQCISRLEMR